MSTEHKRPFIAFLIVVVACAVVMVNGFRSNALFQNAPVVFRAAVAVGANALASTAPLSNDLVEVTAADFADVSEPASPVPPAVLVEQPARRVATPPSRARSKQHVANLRPVHKVRVRQPKTTNTINTTPVVATPTPVKTTGPKTNGHKPKPVKVKHDVKVKPPKVKPPKVKPPKVKPPKVKPTKPPKPPVAPQPPSPPPSNTGGGSDDDDDDGCHDAHHDHDHGDGDGDIRDGNSGGNNGNNDDHGNNGGNSGGDQGDDDRGGDNDQGDAGRN